MNTIRSFWLGWGSVCVAGGGAYYFAKKSIIADRHNKLEEARQRKAIVNALECSGNVAQKPTLSAAKGASESPVRTDAAGSPSYAFGNDPAPTRHATATDALKVVEKSKYEASVPYRSPKGDRFS